jgi:hypothetical protein
MYRRAVRLIQLPSIQTAIKPGDVLLPAGMFLQLNLILIYARQLEVCTWLQTFHP